MKLKLILYLWWISGIRKRSVQQISVYFSLSSSLYVCFLSNIEWILHTKLKKSSTEKQTEQETSLFGPTGHSFCPHSGGTGSHGFVQKRSRAKKSLGTIIGPRVHQGPAESLLWYRPAWASFNYDSGWPGQTEEKCSLSSKTNKTVFSFVLWYAARVHRATRTSRKSSVNSM